MNDVNALNARLQTLREMKEEAMRLRIGTADYNHGVDAVIKMMEEHAKA